MPDDKARDTSVESEMNNPQIDPPPIIPQVPLVVQISAPQDGMVGLPPNKELIKSYP